MTYPPCPYCGKPTEIRDSREIYGRSYGLALICSGFPACDSYVGCHQDSGLPKGTLANAELRIARKQAHAAFDPLWRRPGDKRAHRQRAYAWLTAATGIPADDCHIGMMDVARCRLVIDAIKNGPTP